MQKLKNWLNGLSDVLPDLLIGILLYGVVAEYGTGSGRKRCGEKDAAA